MNTKFSKLIIKTVPTKQEKQNNNKIIKFDGEKYFLIHGDTHKRQS